jgi:D-proline reductase (dithiol) PrdB
MLMATYRELILKYRLFMKAYPFTRYAIQPVPCAKLDKPLNVARVALVTTAGLHSPDQPGFDHSFKGGDVTFREISQAVETSTLIESHKSDAFDHSGVQADRNLAFPLDRFRELEARGEIGALNHRHFSFMGSITKPERLIAETAPLAARLLRDDGVDVAFLTPV